MCSLEVRVLQSVRIRGLKKVGHFAKNLPDTSSPNIMVKSCSIKPVMSRNRGKTSKTVEELC